VETNIIELATDHVTIHLQANVHSSAWPSNDKEQAWHRQCTAAHSHTPYHLIHMLVVQTLLITINLETRSPPH